jgi:hypothetical protein
MITFFVLLVVWQKSSHLGFFGSSLLYLWQSVVVQLDSLMKTYPRFLYSTLRTGEPDASAK